jgi:glucose/arabinose dehydrogenase
MSFRPLKLLALTLACSFVPAAIAQAAGPPPPTSPTGKTVSLVAAGGGLAVPTSFAFGKGTIFEGDGGKESGPPSGGVFVLKGGKAASVASSLKFVAGLAWHKGALYVSGGTPVGKSAVWSIQKWSGWNGKKFASQKAIFTAPSGFDGFNGIAFGPDNRLYVGVDLGLQGNHDHGPATLPFAYSILSMNADGSNLEQFATGIRQPWQLAFAPGSKNPLVSALNQDSGPPAPDYVLKVHEGDDFGFPICNGTKASSCALFAKPFQTFAPHTDIMGMAIIGKTLYMTSFANTTGKGPGGEVVSMPLTGGKLTPVLTGFVAPTVGLGVDQGKLYVGELTAEVFSVKP